MTSRDIILSAVTDKDVHPIDISQYKKLIVSATFAGGGGADSVIDVPVLEVLTASNGSLRLVLSNYIPSSSNYYGRMQIILNATSIQMNSENHGSSVTSVSYNLVGRK